MGIYFVVEGGVVLVVFVEFEFVVVVVLVMVILVVVDVVVLVVVFVELVVEIFEIVVRGVEIVVISNFLVFKEDLFFFLFNEEFVGMLGFGGFFGLEVVKMFFDWYLFYFLYCIGLN